MTEIELNPNESIEEPLADAMTRLEILVQGMNNNCQYDAALEVQKALALLGNAHDILDDHRALTATMGPS